jgi:RimJ/RimL family protein N-acetyltransferase
VSWKKAEAGDLPELLALARAQEGRAVHFSSRLRPARTGGRAGLPSRLEATVLVHRTGAEATAALLLTSGGLLLPLLAAPGQEGIAAPRFPSWRGLARALHSIMGPLREVRWAESNLPFPARVSVDYHLMGLKKRDYLPPALAPAPAGLRLREAGPQDARGLYPLQRDYELEEVLIEPGHFDPQACLANLRKTLRRQIVIMAELDGRPVSKAGTNARGFDADQIGGVFTVEDERGRGLARRVMVVLLERIFREKSLASLFVKKLNPAAVALYHRLGFREQEDFRISYFGA